MKLLIASSAFNEEENIENFVKEIKINFDKFQKICKFPVDLELIIANNNSQDNTLEKLISLKKKFSFLRVYNNNSNYGADISTLNFPYGKICALSYSIKTQICRTQTAGHHRLKHR